MSIQLESIGGKLYINGEEVLTAGGSPEAYSNPNLLINGNMLINQRGFDGTTWVDTEYAYDRWKATATAMFQIVEDGSYAYSTEHTLSYDGGNAVQIISPASGDWTIPEVPRTARAIKLEVGSVATPYQARLIGEELALCRRYYKRLSGDGIYSNTVNGFYNTPTDLVCTERHNPPMRIAPTISFSDITLLDIEPFDVLPTSVGPMSPGTINSTTLIVADPIARTQGFAGALVTERPDSWIAFDAEL